MLIQEQYDLKIANAGEIKEYIKYMYSRKPVYMNYFNQPITSNDRYWKTNDSLIIVKQIDDFCRIFILSNETQEIIKFLNSFQEMNVINIPSKEDISNWEHLMQTVNYRKIGIYERYYYTNVKSRKNTENILYANSYQVREIYELLYQYEQFSPYTDYLPTYSELEQLISQKQVIINKEKSRILGLFIFSIERKKCYFRAWIDKSNNGLKLLFDMYGIMWSQNITYAYFWINSKNEQVKKIHQLFGARPDGLKDYTFIKQ
jgi:hypothetical protein